MEKCFASVRAKSARCRTERPDYSTTANSGRGNASSMISATGSPRPDGQCDPGTGGAKWPATQQGNLEADRLHSRRVPRRGRSTSALCISFNHNRDHKRIPLVIRAEPRIERFAIHTSGIYRNLVNNGNVVAPSSKKSVYLHVLSE